MAKKSKRLQLVLELAQRKQQQAEQMLVASRARVEQGRRGAAQLEAFLAEYQQQYVNNQGQTLSVAQLQNQQAFMAKIATALQQQQQAAAMQQRELATLEQHWKQAYGRAKAMATLVDSAREQERQLEEKQLQRAIDERSQLIKANFI